MGIKQLAAKVGVSIGTVSRAVNNRYGVNPATRARVLAAARRHGYVPNPAARLLKEHPMSSVGLFFAPFAGPEGEINPTALALIETLRREMKARAFDLQVSYYRDDDDLRKQADARHLEVILFFGHFAQHTFDVARNLGHQVIIIGNRSLKPGSTAVLADTRYCAAAAVQYLAALGHERLALVTGPRSETHNAGYIDGFDSAVREFALTARADWRVELSASLTHRDGACAATRPLLGTRTRPTAFVFSSDWLAMGGRRAIIEAGLRVPGDVSIIGYDNLPAAAELEPPLTTFDPDIAAVAQTVTSLVNDLGRKGRREAREIHFQPRLLKRQSCATRRT